MGNETSVRSLFKIGSLAFVAGAATFSIAFGAAVSHRFGYTGTVWRFDTLEDAQAFRVGGNPAPTQTYTIGNRDLALNFRNNHSSLSDRFIFMGSWWYTTERDADGNPRGRGWGNTRGNTGLGFTQLFDQTGQFTQTSSYAWSNWLGSYYDTFSLSVTGANAGSAASSRFSLTPSNTGDTGIWLDYSLNMKVTGLQGKIVGGLIVDEIDHLTADRPFDVDGSFKGIFQNTSSTITANNGFYVFDLSLNMINWAYDNRADLAIDPFVNSYFATSVPADPVPEPFTMGLVGAAALAALKRRRQKKA